MCCLLKEKRGFVNLVIVSLLDFDSLRRRGTFSANQNKAFRPLLYVTRIKRCFFARKNHYESRSYGKWWKSIIEKFLNKLKIGLLCSSMHRSFSFRTKNSIFILMHKREFKPSCISWKRLLKSHFKCLKTSFNSEENVLPSDIRCDHIIRSKRKAHFILRLQTINFKN